MFKQIAAFAAVLALATSAQATLTTTTNSASYTGNGSTTAFTVPFKFLATTDLVVTVAGVTQALGSNYTVKGAGAATGTVTFTVAPPAGQTVVIARRVPLTQTASVRTALPFPAGATIEGALDKLTMQNQQLANTAASAAATGLLTAADWVRFNNVVLQPLNQFQAAGAGSVIRGIGEKLSDIVSVKDFGAKGDGATDDTAAIQAAIVAGDGKTLVFPPGTYKITTVSISTTNGLTLRGRGATLATNQKIAVQFTGASSNIVFDGLRFSTSEVSTSGVYGLITGIAAWPLINIKVVDCDFTGPTSSTNGIKFDLSDVASSLVGLEVSGSRFVNIGQMGVEVINHTFDETSRFEQIRIVNNRFDGLALTSGSLYGMAVSLSGRGQNNVLANNNISQCKDIGLEIVGPWHTAVSNNVIRNMQPNCIGISTGKPASAINKPQGLTISGNVIDGNGGFALQPVGLQYSTITGNVITGTGKVSIETGDYLTISGNTIDVTNAVVLLTLTYATVTGNRFTSRTNTAGFNPSITGTTLSSFAGNTFQSERGTGLLLNNSTANNVFTGNIFSNENSAAAGPAIQFDGAATTNNVMIGSIIRRSGAGGSTFVQTTSATGNIVGLATVNTMNPTAGDKYALPLTLTTGGNGWLQTATLNGQFLWSDSTGLLRIKATAPTADTDGAGLACGAATTSCGATTLTAGTATVTVRSGCRPLCTNTTSVAAVKCAVSATTLTITGTGTDAVNWFCY